MKIELFAIKDHAADRFLDPFPAPTIEFALRGFREACSADGHQFAKFPEDFDLYHVGRFDAPTGVLETLQPRKIANATSFTGGYGNPLTLEDEAEA